MSCSDCADLCQEVPVRTPGELRKVLGIAKANLDDATLVQLTDGQGLDSVVPRTPLVELNPDGPLPDIIRADLRCVHCGELFRLDCETYHGGGGKWSYGDS